MVLGCLACLVGREVPRGRNEPMGHQQRLEGEVGGVLRRWGHGGIMHGSYSLQVGASAGLTTGDEPRLMAGGCFVGNRSAAEWQASKACWGGGVWGNSSGSRGRWWGGGQVLWDGAGLGAAAAAGGRVQDGSAQGQHVCDVPRRRTRAPMGWYTLSIIRTPVFQPFIPTAVGCWPRCQRVPILGMQVEGLSGLYTDWAPH